MKTPTPEMVARQFSGWFDIPKTFVDIGASDGTSSSNTYGLLKDGWSGISIERDPLKAANATERYVGLKCKMIEAKATPCSVMGLLGDKMASDFGFLSIDIDGYDLAVLETLLIGGFRPAVICSEINPTIPPPYKFLVKYSEDYSWGVNDFYGHSLSALDALMQDFGYVLDQLLGDNAIYTRCDVEPKGCMDEYFDGFLNNKDFEEPHHVYARRQCKRIMDAPTHDDALRIIFDMWPQYSGRFRAFV